MSLFPTSGLSRGQNIALLKEHPDLRSVVVSIDWDTAGDRGLDDALSMAALLCGPDGRVRDDGDLVYFNQMISADASAEHRSTGAPERSRRRSRSRWTWTGCRARSPRSSSCSRATAAPGPAAP